MSDNTQERRPNDIVSTVSTDKQKKRKFGTDAEYSDTNKPDGNSQTMENNALDQLPSVLIETIFDFLGPTIPELCGMMRVSKIFLSCVDKYCGKLVVRYKNFMSCKCDPLLRTTLTEPKISCRSTKELAYFLLLKILFHQERNTCMRCNFNGRWGSRSEYDNWTPRLVDRYLKPSPPFALDPTINTAVPINSPITTEPLDASLDQSSTSESEIFFDYGVSSQRQLAVTRAITQLPKIQEWWFWGQHGCCITYARFFRRPDRGGWNHDRVPESDLGGPYLIVRTDCIHLNYRDGCPYCHVRSAKNFKERGYNSAGTQKPEGGCNCKRCKSVPVNTQLWDLRNGTGRWKSSAEIITAAVFRNNTKHQH